jgi:hypothetical protein
MNTSKFLSKVIGLYLILISSAMLIDMNQFIASVTQMINDAPLLTVCGYFTVILGLLLVVSHNIWEWHWRVIITLFAWLVLIKGTSLIFFPQFIDSASMMFLQNIHVAYGTAGFDLILGILLAYLGFKRS